MNAPPVAVVATKSSWPPSLHAAGDEAGPRLRRGERASRRPPPQRGDEQRRLRPGTTKRLHGASVYGAARRGSRYPAIVRRPCRRRRRLEQYARLAVQVGLNLQPGQTLGVNALVEHAPFARAIARQAYAAGAQLRRRPLHRPARAARAHRARGRRRARLLAAVARQAARRARPRRAARCSRSPATRSPSSSPTSTAARVGRARMREVAEASLRLTDGLCNWSIVAFPNEGWAHDGLRRARRRAALGGGRDGGAPRRARSGRGLARAHRQARPRARRR